MKTFKLRPLLTLFTVITVFVLFVAVFLYGVTYIHKLRDKLAKANAYIASTENELIELEKEYDALKERFAELEQMKSMQKGAPVVYLTFDDGPSKNTVKILDILDEYNIKATFFIIGNEQGYAADIYRRLAESGHTVGGHTFSHEYKDIYSSTEHFWSEYNKINEFYYSLTGKNLQILRFPGGSNNTVSERYCKGIMKTLVKQAQQKGITYFDWNVSSLDAEKVLQDKNVIINAVLDGVEGRESSIVLMHDNGTKTTTVDALPVIIEALNERGYVFKALTEDVEPVQFYK